MSSREAVAEHEAAHVVTGVALGLRLISASAIPAPDCLGYAQFRPTMRHEAYAIMCAAGIAWERASQGRAARARFDRARIREFFTDAAIEPFVIAAEAILRTRLSAHARVTRLLLERDISDSDIQALARGEIPDE